MELAALLDDVLGVAGKPGRHPLGALEERQRRLAGAANRPAPNETARVDEAHVLEAPARPMPTVAANGAWPPRATSLSSCSSSVRTTMRRSPRSRSSNAVPSRWACSP